MNKYIIIIFFLLSFPLHAQDYMSSDYMCYDDGVVIDSMMGKMNIDKWLIYQVKLLNDSIIYSNDSDDDKIVTFLFWLDKGQTYIKLFTNTNIYSKFELYNCQIFNYKSMSFN